MKISRSLAAAMVLASSFAVACVGEPTDSESIEGGDTAEATEALEAGDDAATPDKGERHRDKRGKRGHEMGKMGGGPMGAFMKSLHELDLTADQQATLKELRTSLRENMKGEHGDDGLSKALAENIAAGNVSVSAFSAELDAIEAKADSRVAAMQQAFNTLHATLTPEQRAELVTNIESRMAEREAHMQERGGKRAGKRGKRAHHMLGMLTHKLDLSDEQIEQVKALEGDRPEVDWSAKKAEMKAKMKAMLTAFASSSFDAAALGVGNEMKGMARAKSEKMIEGLSQLVPILDAEQRTQLAEMVEQRSMHMGNKGQRGRFGKRGGRGLRPERPAPDGQAL